MKKLFVLALLLTTYVGCATWEQRTAKTLDIIHTAGVEAREQGMPFFNSECYSRAEVCVKAGTLKEDCVPLLDCRKAREVFGNVLTGVQFIFIDGKLALAIGDEGEVNEAIDKAVDLLKEARGQIAYIVREVTK